MQKLKEKLKIQIITAICKRMRCRMVWGSKMKRINN